MGEIPQGRAALAVKKIEHVSDQILLKNIFEAWVGAVKEAKRTREYFARLERGDLDDDSDTQLFGQGEAKDDVSSLPWQAAIKIFMFLGIIDLAHCSQVCQSWKVITQTSVLWNKMDFYPIKDWIKDNGVTYLLRQYRPYAIHLSLRSCTNLSWPSFKSVSECRNLQDLNLSGCAGLTDEYLAVILENCSSILFLNLSYTTISDVSMRTLSKCCLNLQYLSVAFCRRFSDRGLNYLASGKGCHRLIYLDLSGCTQISVKGFKALSIACNEVQHLIINDMATLTDSCIVALVAHYYKLSSISLLGSPHLYDSAIKALVQWRKLTKIKIDGNKHITDNSLKFICRYCSQMRILCITDCPRITDVGLKFTESLRNLIVLNLADCVRLTDVGLKHFADGNSGPKVRELNLTNCINISDFLLIKLVQRCTNLTHVKFCYCEHLSDNGIELLGTLPNLTSVDLTGTTMQDQSLAALSTNSKCTELIISECQDITDIGLQKFCHRSINLNYLDVSHCMALSNQSIKTLSFSCRLLTYLNISACPKITDLSLQYLIGGCHYLRYLDISGCVRVTDVIFKLLKKGFRKLLFLKMLYCTKITKSAFDKQMRANIQCEFNNFAPPLWYGYDGLGNIIKKEEKNQEEEEEDEDTELDEDQNQDDEDKIDDQVDVQNQEENQDEEQDQDPE
ncbi:dynein regulatory complex subunit 6 [Callorhinchus milii]|uniref:dynein regulatory complex subunit 6 n=1 Tax=Callorhinchus milii TaxID=7868 RepID=UPI001C3FB2E5|nr:dynein regulatory complex subunit 6 [Callorhinchus milii]